MAMNIRNIIVTGRLFQELEPLLQHRTDKQFRFIPEAEVGEADYEWADAFVAFKPTAHFHFAQLQWVHALGAGVDAFVRQRDWKPEVVLTRTIGSFGQKISEYCLSYLLADAQQHNTLKQQQILQNWVPVTPKPLNEQKVVVFGTGTIGQAIARNLAYFGVEVVGVSKSGTSKPAFSQNVAMDSDLSSRLGSADWVINTLPLTRDTERMFDEAIFGQMQQGGFINVGRGGSVNQDALLRALEREQVRLAVLDVFEEEPLSAGSPLWEHSRICITPHISAVTDPLEAAKDFLKVLDAIDQGYLPSEHIVDPQQGY